MQEPGFLKHQEQIRISENRLPHWEQDDCTYFLSFRLADSLPQSLLAAWREERSLWLQHNPEPWSEAVRSEYQDLFSRRRETWLDQGHGHCALKDPRLRDAVEKAIFAQTRGEVIWSLVLMPNHAHALVSLPDFRDGALGRLLKSWKGASARTANRVQRVHGSFWAKDYFDRLIRDSQHFVHCARYIRSNPAKACLQNGAFSLWEHPYVRKLIGG